MIQYSPPSETGPNSTHLDSKNLIRLRKYVDQQTSAHDVFTTPKYESYFAINCVLDLVHRTPIPRQPLVGTPGSNVVSSVRDHRSVTDRQINDVLVTYSYFATKPRYATYRQNLQPSKFSPPGRTRLSTVGLVLSKRALC